MSSVNAGRVGRPPGLGARTRAQILLAAADVMSRVGYDAMTLEEVASQCGVTRPAIYQYFDSKVALAQEVLSVSGDVMYAKWRAAADCQEDLTHKLKAICLASLESASTDPASTLGFVGLARAARNDAEMRKLFVKRSKTLRVFVQTLIDEASTARSLPSHFDRDDTVEAMCGLIWMVSVGAAEAPTARVRTQIALGIDLLFEQGAGATARA